jgi:hypothetical protein
MILNAEFQSVKKAIVFYFILIVQKDCGIARKPVAITGLWAENRTRDLKST